MRFSDSILAIDDCAMRMRRRHDQICGREKNLLGREDADAKVFMGKIKSNCQYTETGCYRSDYGLWWAYETHVVALSPEAYNYSLVIGCLWAFSSAQFEGTGFRMRSNVTCSPADARKLA